MLDQRLVGVKLEGLGGTTGPGCEEVIVQAKDSGLGGTTGRTRQWVLIDASAD